MLLLEFVVPINYLFFLFYQSSDLTGHHFCFITQQATLCSITHQPCGLAGCSLYLAFHKKNIFITNFSKNEETSRNALNLSGISDHTLTCYSGFPHVLLEKIFVKHSGVCILLLLSQRTKNQKTDCTHIRLMWF